MNTDAPGGLTRRALVAAAAWTLPAITLAVAAPAAAASVLSPAKLELQTGIVIWADAGAPHADGLPQYPYGGGAAGPRRARRMRFLVDLANTGDEAVAPGTVVTFTLSGLWSNRLLRTVPAGISVTSSNPDPNYVPPAGTPTNDTSQSPTVTVVVTSEIPSGWTGRFDFIATAPNSDQLAAPFTARLAVLPVTVGPLAAETSFRVTEAGPVYPVLDSLSLPLGHEPVPYVSAGPGGGKTAYLTGRRYSWEILYHADGGTMSRSASITFTAVGFRLSDVRLDSTTLALESFATSSSGAQATTSVPTSSTQEKLVISAFIDPVKNSSAPGNFGASFQGDPGLIYPQISGPYTADTKSLTITVLNPTI
jgi:hypothetical protein